ALYLAADEHYPAFERLQHFVLVPGAAVLGDHALVVVLFVGGFGFAFGRGSHSIDGNRYVFSRAAAPIFPHGRSDAPRRTFGRRRPDLVPVTECRGYIGSSFPVPRRVLE